MSSNFSDCGAFQFDFDTTYQGLDPFDGLDAIPEIDMDFINTSPDFSLDGFTALEPTMDRSAIPSPKQRKMSASRPIINSYPDPEQLFSVPQTQYTNSPYFSQPPQGNVPFHNFLQITPPGTQTSSIHYPMFTPGNMVPLRPPPKGKSRQIESSVDSEDLAHEPGKMQPDQKRKRPTPMSLRGKPPEHDSDSSVSSASPSASSSSSSIPYIRPLPPGNKKLGRPYVYKQTKETRERNARRVADYHKRKKNSAYMAKMNQWSREYYQRKKQMDVDKWELVKWEWQMEKRGKNENSKRVEEVGQGEESDEYVYGRSSQQAQGEAVGMRRSSRQPKPRFANLEF
ncbi:hypothetical protein ABVK25_000528 [Lepraria finkii]|uniref:BZIP domain-containing protein n=1 Tax=Lepraria finkii TaxID=1340010 RepID=A0ABR4BQK6_9LECA